MKNPAVREQEELKRLRINLEPLPWLNQDYRAYRSEPTVKGDNPEPEFYLFKKKKVIFSPAQSVYGHQPTQWGRGYCDSGSNPIWVVGFLLNELTRIPGIAVFHGLKVPGSGCMVDVEHAVLVGDTVYLIESDCRGSSSGNGWYQNKRGKTISSKGEDGWRHTHIADVSEYYRKHLGPRYTVVPIISLTGPDAAVTGERWSPRGVGLFTAYELLDYIGSAAAGSLPQTQAVNKNAAEVLLSTLR